MRTRALTKPINGTHARQCAERRRLGLAFTLAMGAALSLVEPALAQTAPQLATTPVERSDGYVFRSIRPYWINYEDCIADDQFIFSFTLSSLAELEVWVGSDNCADRRGLSDRGQCWIVAKEANPSRTISVVVPVRNVVARALQSTQVPENVPASVCDEPSVTSPTGETLTYYFMHIENGQAASYSTWDGGPEKTGYDVVGPEPPDAISVGVGESQLAIDINGVGESVDRERFEAFCVPTGTLADAGGPDPSAIDAGDSPAGTGGGAPAACATALVRAGERPPLAFSCGTAGETSRTLRTSRLDNGVTYAVGVAGQDILGNPGVLSEIACGTPAVLDDFFEVYSRNGGPGGGGFCSVTAPGAARAAQSLPWFALLGLACAWRRRRAGSSR